VAFASIACKRIHVQPQDVIGPYESALAGYTAFAIAMALIGSIIIGAVYAVSLWYRREE